MAFRNEFVITNEIRRNLCEIFEAQYQLVEGHPQQLFSFTQGPFSDIKEYYNKLSFEHLNLVYSYDDKRLMDIFAITGKRSIKIEKLFNKSNLRCLGIRVHKNCEIPMHIDANYQDMGRSHPVCSMTISGDLDSVIFLSNSTDGSHQAAFPGLSTFCFEPTKIAHGAISGPNGMDILQIMIDPF